MAEDSRFKAHGTSFFLNFHPFCDVHQMLGAEGDRVRKQIVDRAVERFFPILEKHWPKELAELDHKARSLLSPMPRPFFDNGELFIWIEEVVLPEENVLRVISDLRRSLEEEPIRIASRGEELPVRFYGYGFRYVPGPGALGRC